MDEAEARRSIQVALHAVKHCFGCNRTLPIQSFHMPTAKMHKGQRLCMDCMRADWRYWNQRRRSA